MFQGAVASNNLIKSMFSSGMCACRLCLRQITPVFTRDKETASVLLHVFMKYFSTETF